MSIECRDLFAGHIDLSLTAAVKVLTSYPASASAFMKLGKGLKQAEKRRKESVGADVAVPPLIIVSTTEKCNLACAGCYSCAKHQAPKEELADERVAELMYEASELGVSIVMLAGGEPLLSHSWLNVMAGHDEMVGIVFTNGTLFDEARVEWFGRYRHVFPAFSLEGDEAQTDKRRGRGTYAKVDAAMQKLKSNGIPFGVSITVTSDNIDSILCDEFTSVHIDKGCRLFVFVEYVPVEPGSEPLVLSKSEKRRLDEFATQSAKNHPALFVPFPGNEEYFGGCLAAGRGFVHISAAGDIEPCPFAPFSDTNLTHVSLKEALTSAFLAKVREHHHLLKEGEGGCALWHNRQWLDSLL